MSLQPVALYGLAIPPGGHLVPAMQEDSFPDASFRITMAAIDPTEPPEADDDGNIPTVPRSTLRIVRRSAADLDDELDDEYLEQIMGGSDSDGSDSDEEEEEANGGPSDPSKSKKAKRAADLKKLLESTKDEDSDEEMKDGADAKVNGAVKSKKGKEPATSSDDDEEDDDDESDDSSLELEDFVVCTLDTQQHYQQTLDITVGPNEQVFFVSTGTHTIHLTGNYVIDVNDSEGESDDYDEDDEDDYDLEELEGLVGGSDSEEDELDGLDNPRVAEIESDEEEAPKLVEAKPTKGKNKRAAEEAEGLDELIAKAQGETKLSKKQQKKLKNNQGEAVAVKDDDKDTTPKSDKKVQFAKNLEQGPTGSAAAEKKGTLGVKVVGGVTVDDRKIGTGRTVKKGDKVEVRYIGKLQDGKVFDSNKKGKPFSFGVGKNEVIKGWDIGLAGMAVGGERRLTIPAHLAYGKQAQPGIPANSTLVFDIKLLGIK